MIKRVLLALAALVCCLSGARADFAFTLGSGATAFSFTAATGGTSICAASVTHCFASVPINTAGVAFFTSGNPGLVTLTGTNTVSQATAGNLNATVVGTGTFATQAAQSGTWNVGTVTTITTLSTLTGGGVASGSADSGNPVKIGGKYNASPVTLTDGNRGDLQLDVNGYAKVNVTNANANGQATLANSSPVAIASNQSITGQNVASPASFIDACQFNTSPTTITSGNVSPFQCDSGGKLLVNTGTVTVSATNLSTNVAQINGVTPLMGNGVTGTGSQRVTVASDNTAFTVNAAQSGTWNVTNVSGTVSLPTGAATSANQTTWQSATAAAPPANAVYLGANASGATGGLMAGLIQCDSTAVYDASTNGSTQLQALTTGRTIYVCGYSILSGGTVNVKLIYGTGAACATGSTNMTPAYQLTAQVGIVDGGIFSRGLKTASANALCINTSAGVAVQAIVYYAVF